MGDGAKDGSNVDSRYFLPSVEISTKIVFGRIFDPSAFADKPGNRFRLELALVQGQCGTLRPPSIINRSPMAAEKMSELVRRKRRLEDEMEQIREAMKTVLQKLGALTGRTNSIYLKFEDVYEKQSEELTELNKEQEALHRELEGTKNMFILINGSVYDNTHIKVNGNSLIVDEEKKNVRFYSQGRQIITE